MAGKAADGTRKTYVMAHLVVLTGIGGIVRFFPFWHGSILLNRAVGICYLAASVAGILYLRKLGVAWLFPAAAEMCVAGARRRGKEAIVGFCYAFMVLIPMVSLASASEHGLVLSHRTLNLLDSAAALVALAVSVLALSHVFRAGEA